MIEKELAKPVVEWLEAQHWEVYQEVRFTPQGGIADICAVRDNKLWILETKTSLTFTVLEQASNWRSHFRSIAVPYARHNRDSRKFVYDIAYRYLKLGVISVFMGNVVEEKPAPLMRDYHRYAKSMMKRLLPEHKHYCEAGAANGGYYTPYRATMDQVKRYIQQNPGCSLKEIMDGIDRHHYSNDKTARSCIRVALSSWESGWCRTEKDGNVQRYFTEVI